MKNTLKISCLALSMAALSTSAHSAVMVLDLTTGAAAGTLAAGDTLDMGSPFEYTFSGVTLTASATSNFGDNTAVFNATASNAGVNTGGGGSSIGDDPSQIDAGETLTFTFTFNSTVSDLTLTEIDFAALGDSSDSATVMFGSTTLTLFDGVTDVTGADIWNPSGGVTFLDGDSITFSNTSGDAYRLTDMTFNVENVPEPSSTALLGLGGLALILPRRK